MVGIWSRIKALSVLSCLCTAHRVNQTPLCDHPLDFNRVGIFSCQAIPSAQKQYMPKTSPTFQGSQLP